MKDEPFNLLWVISDGSREYFEARRSRSGADWPHIFMPCGTKSPISHQWGIREWPTIFLLDRQGIIRYRGNENRLGGTPLEIAVKTLLAENSEAGTE
jgi:hypothetical protein